MSLPYNRLIMRSKSSMLTNWAREESIHFLLSAICGFPSSILPSCHLASSRHNGTPIGGAEVHLCDGADQLEVSGDASRLKTQDGRTFNVCEPNKASLMAGKVLAGRTHRPTKHNSDDLTRAIILHLCKAPWPCLEFSYWLCHCGPRNWA